MDSVRIMSFTSNSLTSSTTTGSNDSTGTVQEEFGAEDGPQQFVSGPTLNIFSTKKDLVASCTGLHSINEDEEELVPTQVDEDGGHDSDAITERDEEEDEATQEEEDIPVAESVK